MQTELTTTTLQQRIEERAKKRLLNDLVKASNIEGEIQSMFYGHFNKAIEATWYKPSYGSSEVQLRNNFTKELFENLLPRYISIITDEILQKIDEIDYLLKEQNQPEEY